jgi:outer membrane protein TolC
MTAKSIVLASMAFLVAVSLHAQHTFANFRELEQYTDAHSITVQTNDIKLLQAKQSKLAAIAGIPNPTLNNSLSFTNNTRLPVNLFPAEAFGGQPGEFREIQTGVQFNTAISSNLNINLLDMEAWKNLELANLNIAVTQTDNQLRLKSLRENMAVTYYNIVQLQAQLESTRQHVVIADTLLRVAEHKYQSGIAKQQDVNDARVNQINTQENIRQIEYLIRQQYLSLKILCDIPESESVVITEKPGIAAAVVPPVVAPNSLLLRSNALKEQSAYTNLRKAKYAYLPTIAFVANNSYNQYNPDFTVFGGNWINSQYVGLRLNFNLPNATTVANQSKAKYEYQISQKNAAQATLKSSLEQQQLANDWDKAASQLKANEQVLALQRDTYQKNKNLYNEGLLAIDRTLSSFTAMLNANYNLISSQVNTALAQTKIDINNTFK